MPKKTGQLSVRVSSDLQSGLEAIEAKHHIGQAEIVRGLVAAAVAFFNKEGWFSFPVKITPEIFQNPEGSTAAPAEASAGKSRVSTSDKWVESVPSGEDFDTSPAVTSARNKGIHAKERIRRMATEGRVKVGKTRK